MPSRHVLVIDDDPASLSVAERMLRLEGYVVSTAVEPNLTPTELAQLAPDLIVLDYWFGRDPRSLPFLYALRADSRTRQLPVLLVTAAIQAVGQAQEHFAALGCTVLFKPFELDEFVAAVEQRMRETATPPSRAGEPSYDAMSSGL
jgi:DNA-binding response OmpR family regulator